MHPTATPPDDAPLPLPEEQATVAPHPPALKAIFLTWLRIGAFSFGGDALPDASRVRPAPSLDHR
jgi:hypothetical protein